MVIKWYLDNVYEKYLNVPFWPCNLNFSWPYTQNEKSYPLLSKMYNSRKNATYKWN